MISMGRVRKILSVFHRRRILVVGDVMLDRYLTGDVDRISPEAPVPVLRVTGEECRPGGSANVALNVRSLGGQAVVAGLIGRDAAADKLRETLVQRGVDPCGLVTHGGMQTIAKTRVLAGRQQMLRIDREDPPSVARAALKKLHARLAHLVGTVDGVIIEDYGKGVVTQELVDTVLRVAGRKRICVGLDPKDNHELMLRGITLATPNYKEARVMAGLPDAPLSDPAGDPRLKATADILCEKWDPELLIITLGPHGMYLAGKGEKRRIIPTRAREVFDVCGAGDTVIATAVLALVSGASHYEAASIANGAAGVVVAKVGTATCTQKELLANLE